MKHSRSILLVLFFLPMILENGRGQSDHSRHNTDDSRIALQGYSPVSYIDMNLAQRGSKDYMSEYDGLKYYFVDAAQKARFDADPERYLPQYGGWCATGIAVGAYFRTDPDKFLVRNGRLYLFLYDLEVDALQLWLSDEKNMAAKAEENWSKMSR